MKSYLSVFRIKFTSGLQYRAAAYAGIATQFAWGFLELFLYSAFYRSDASAFPMSFPQLSSYIWLRQALLALYMSWLSEPDIFQAITGGNIAYELARPMDIYSLWFVRTMASRAAKAVLRCLPILLVAAFLPYPYGMSLPADPLSFVMFLFTMIMSFLVVVAFSMLIYISVFYTLSPLGVRIVAVSLTDFLSGAIIPLPFMPDGFRRVVELTPFASMENLPFRIYSGNIAGPEMLRGILLQVFWLAALILIGRLWIRHAMQKVVIQGG